MARPTIEARLQSIHQDAMVEFNAIQAAARDVRLECLKDRRFCFIPGAQWEGLEPQFANKPRYEVNKVALGVRRIVNDYRNNRIDVSFVSKDGAADESLAETCAALYRSDEQDSTAEEAFDNAYEEAVSGGIGAWRLRACYEDEYEEYDEDDENRPQRIRIEPIPDADSSVFFDLNAKRQDKSDARTCFVITSMTRDEYKRKYDDDPATWTKSITQVQFDWTTPRSVYIAEYYVVEEKPETVHIFRGLGVSGPGTGDLKKYTQTQLDEDDDLSSYLSATGFQEIGSKKVKSRKVHKYVLNGARVIEDCKYIAGREIPIVVTYGQRWFIDNNERCMGNVRLARDAQRIKNMLISKIAEISAFSPVRKPIVTPEQIKGHEQVWADDNVKQYAYRPINPLTDATGSIVTAAPLGYIEPPDVPPATALLHQFSEQDIRDVLGNPEQGEKMLSHVAGKAVEAIQQRIDGNSFVYISNMSKAHRRCGQIWLSMACELYTDEGRKMKGIGPSGERSQVELMKPNIGPDAQVTYDNDLSRARFDVAVNIGPSSVSKRQAATREATNMLAVTQDQETQTVLGLLAVKNMEGEGIEGAREWARQKLIRMGAEKPTQEEAQQLAAEAQNAQPTPNDKYLLAAAQELVAKAHEAQVDAALKAAQADKTRADTVSTLAAIDLDRRKAAVDAAQSLHEMSLKQAALDQGQAIPAPGAGGVNSNV